ncbi:hypothetical protein AURDEDRAFT_165979 [Auricularia subglabra TFB-10046 SS5]|nr:hypothetical protein AURDEDRAFT_165979 [Auricularia subglabra TFB-10046 SS5]
MGECRANVSARRALPPQKQLHLPTELWCDIWERLPFSACIAVTHTCRAWRLTALAWPSIWTRPVFFLRRSISPTLVSLPESDFCCCRRCHQPSEGANALYAREVFGRSSDRPLHLEIITDVWNSCQFVIQEFVLALSCVSIRIASLTVHSVHPYAAETLLREITRPRTPALREGIHELVSYAILRCLTICNAGVQAMHPLHPVSLPALNAPNLEILELAPWFSLREGSAQYSNLRRLSWAPMGDIRWFTSNAPRLVPLLEYMTVDLGAPGASYWSIHGQHTTFIFPVSLRLVKIVNVSESHAAWALGMFHAPSIPGIAIARLSPGALQSCSAIFHDLGAGVKLSVLRYNGRVRMTGTDGRGLQRRVSSATSRSSLDQWDALTRTISSGNIDFNNIVRLTVSASHWFLFAAALPGAPAVASLTLVLTRTVAMLLDESRRYAAPVPTRTKFPSLRALDFIRGKTALAYKIGAWDLAAVVRALGIPLPLEALRVDRGIFTGSRAALCGLALNVSFGIFCET